ncbi:MAG: hypothetical protein OEN00_05195 [Gemmatimonadota bacterium]|nr:hypothetical protein [Gemmatimonadota bacterium]
MAKATVKVRLLLSEGGAFHTEEVEIPAASVAAYERLIDCLREDASVLKSLHVDVDRLSAAYVVPKGG